MTEKQKEQLEKLLALKEQEEKADAEFFKKVRKRKAEVLKVLGIKEKEDKPNYYEKELQKIANAYGTDIPTLLKYIQTQQQVNYYRNTHYR